MRPSIASTMIWPAAVPIPLLLPGRPRPGKTYAAAAPCAPRATPASRPDPCPCVRLGARHFSVPGPTYRHDGDILNGVATRSSLFPFIAGTPNRPRG